MSGFREQLLDISLGQQMKFSHRWLRPLRTLALTYPGESKIPDEHPIIAYSDDFRSTFRKTKMDVPAGRQNLDFSPCSGCLRHPRIYQWAIADTSRHLNYGVDLYLMSRLDQAGPSRILEKPCRFGTAVVMQGEKNQELAAECQA